MSKNIQHKRSSVSGNQPNASQIEVGEIAINFPDRSFYTEDGSNVITELARDVWRTDTQPDSALEGDLWYNTSSGELNYWDGSNWENPAFGASSVDPTNVTAEGGFSSGSGTAVDPYILPTSIVVKGSTGTAIKTITVTGLEAHQFVPVADTSSDSNEGRFLSHFAVANANGVLKEHLEFEDAPESLNPITYTGTYKIGSNSAYINAPVQVVLPLDGGTDIDLPDGGSTNGGGSNNVWSGGNTTLTASGDVELSKDGTTYSSSISVVTGETFYVRFSGAAGSGNGIDQAHGATVSGAVTDGTGGGQSLSALVDKLPAPLGYDGLVDSDQSIAGVSTGPVATISSTNSYNYISGSTTGTNLQYTKDGGSNWNIVPSSDNSSHYAQAGDNLQFRHTNIDSVDASSVATLNVGEITESWKTVTKSTRSQGYVDDVFSTFLYEGTGATQTIANGIDLAGEGGLVWIKNRDNTGGSGYNFWFDTARSPTNSDAMYYLRSDAKVVQETLYNSGSNRDFAGWASNGFTLGSPYFLPGSSLNGPSDDEFCSWTFRKQPGFFDVVTYSGNGSARTISHNLGSVPGMIIVKSTSHDENWFVFHTSLGPTKSLIFESNGAVLTRANDWDNTAPTDSVFTVGSFQGINGVGKDFVAYLFAHDAQKFGIDGDESIIKCVSYGPGTETLDGPEVNLGFEPQWVLTKCYDNSGDWVLHDNIRGVATNGNDKFIRSNTISSELTVENIIFTSTGFKITSTSAYVNQSGKNYIYIAIRRPHKPAEEFAPTDLFSMDGAGQTSNPAFVSNGHVVDMALQKKPASTDATLAFPRLTGNKYLNTTSTAAEASGSSIAWDYMSGAVNGFSATAYQAWMFRRAPGFFDVTAHTSNGQTTQQIDHNLGVVPEMAWIKSTTIGSDWFVYHKDLTTDKNLRLNSNREETTDNTTTSVSFTDSYWTPGNGASSGGSSTQRYISYLFASVPGISKVGIYTGTGSDVDVNCGFSTGARFVLVKRSDSTGDWYLWDSVRGIVSGNDPYLFLNSTAAQVTNTDYIDPLSSGFTITSSAPAALNASSGTYIFLAIA